MRVALVRRGYGSTGGAERYLRRFAEGLEARGQRPLLVTTSDWPEEAWPHGTIVRIPGKSPIEFADHLALALPRLPCDHLFSLERVHACDTYRAGDGVHAAWLKRRAAVETRWKSLFRSFQPKHRSLLKLEADLFHGGARRVVVNSKMVAREIQEFFGTPLENMHLVYNGYDLPPYESSGDPGHGRVATRHRLGITDNSLLVLFSGSGWERKGLADAVAALSLLDRSDMRLIVAGSGKAQSSYQHPRVHFLGPVLDMAPLYAAADVFVLPTLYDPFSNACLEAARHGLPVITTTANGFAELIEPEINGSIVPPSNPARIAAAMDFWATAWRAAEARPVCAAKVAAFTVAANTAATLDAILGTQASGGLEVPR